MIFRVFLGPLLYLVALVVPQSVSRGLDELRDLKNCHCRRMALWLCGFVAWVTLVMRGRTTAVSSSLVSVLVKSTPFATHDIQLQPQGRDLFSPGKH